jgi:hypothetical protein
MGRTPSNADNVVDIRDLIARWEELDDERQNHEDDPETFPDGLDECDTAELASLTSLLDDLKGYGGDHQWRGDWYPVVLYADSYFPEHARETAEDLDLIGEGWPNSCIDWDQAASELQQDYASVDWDGVTFWYRG